MTSPDENPSPTEVLAEIKATRGVLEDLPDRLDAVDKRGRKTLWMVIGTLALIFALVMFFLWNEARNNSEQNDRFNDFAFCQAEYNRVNTLVSKTRAELNTKDKIALAVRDKKIARVVAGGKGDVNEAFTTYANDVAKIEAERADNPLPPYPDCYDKYITHEQTPPGSVDN